jgi:hypothetical protein
MIIPRRPGLRGIFFFTHPVAFSVTLSVLRCLNICSSLLQVFFISFAYATLNLFRPVPPHVVPCGGF